MAHSIRHVRVSGRVQGVFFRESTRQQAERLGLTGFVRNLPSGCVEVLFSGEESAVARGLDFVQTGPPAARVDRVDTFPATQDPPETTEGEFVILPTPGRGDG